VTTSILRGCLLAGFLLVAAYAQPTTQPLLGLTDEQSARLLRSRSIIEKTADSSGTRQGQAEELLVTGWPAATDLLIELLETANEASTRVVICNAVARVRTDHPELVEIRLAEPMVRLLGDGDRSVSTAASAALATFREEHVYRRLGALARDTGRPLDQRLAVVDALAPNIDQRPVIEQLLELLGAGEAAVRRRAHGALVPASRVDYGTGVEAWVRWWQGKSALSESAWLQDRVGLFFQRTRDLQDRVETLQREGEARHNTLSRRLGDVLRLNYRLTAQEAQKSELLIAWLRDPLLDFRLTAVDLVREQVYDQQPPSESLRAALRERYADVSPDLRREVFEVVAALNDPADMEPILARLNVETDGSVRETILGVLGKLRNPGAIGVLIYEIADESSPSNCVAKAAHSLAALAREAGDASQLQLAAAPLRTRLAGAPAEDIRLRGALLGAMAAVGSADFATEFVTALSEERPELLLPAIRGLVAVQDRSQMDRLRALFLHADPRVRLRAMEAVGVLDAGESPLEVLVGHLNPATESNEEVRSAAWGAFCKILKPLPAAIRLKWAARLKDLPGRHIEYLSALVGDYASANPVPAQLNEARELLALLLREQKRYAESVRHLQELYDALSAAGAPRAGELGLLLLDSMLRNGQYSGRIDQLLPDLAKRGDHVKAKVAAIITAYLEEAKQGDRGPEVAVLAERMRRACQGSYGQSLDDYLTDVVHQLTPRPTTGPADPS